MKIFICDDQIEMVENIKAECERYFEQNNIEAEILGDTVYDTTLEEDGNRPDIMVLDIDMPAISGIEIKNRMETYEDGPYIIFVTSHNEMVYDAFGKNVIGFLNKPLNSNLFDKVMEKAVSFYESRFLSVSLPGGLELMCRDIIGIKAEHVYSTLVLNDGELCIRRSLREWEEILPKNDFFRINEKYIIHLAYLNKISGDKAVLKNGKDLPISRRRKMALKECYMSYCLRKGRYR